MDTKEKIEEILRGLALANDDDDIDENETFVSMGADSLDEVELVMAVEEVFNIAVNDEDAEKITTVKEAVNYLTNL